MNRRILITGTTRQVAQWILPSVRQVNRDKPLFNSEEGVDEGGLVFGVSSIIPADVDSRINHSEVPETGGRPEFHTDRDNDTPWNTQ